MFKNRIGYSLLFLAILAGTIKASIPPHERLKAMIRDGLIPKPYFLQHYQELKERGFNNSWYEVRKKKGIQIKSSGLGTLNQNSINNSSTVNSTFKMLVILVDFPDRPKTAEATIFDNLAFGATQGTVKNYYYSLSSGTFDILTVNSPSSIGWQRMPQTYSYYVGGTNGMGSYPNNSQKLAEDACIAVDGIVDFRNYDNDGDGWVDGLMIVHSGAGAEYSGSNDDIWSHTGLMYQPIERDDVHIDKYSMCPEYFATVGDITCGVFVHECAHLIFDLPDLFDINDPSGGGYGGLGKWSLMAAGSWNGSNGKGNSPSYPDAWSRSQMHWGTTQFATVQNIITNTVNLQIQSLGNSSTVYRVWKYGAAGPEYYMLENRQQTGYDSYLPGNGLLIYHIDELYLDNTREWYPGNTANGHYMVALEQADGSYSLEKKQNKGNDGDPFPGSTNKLSFSSLTTPNSNAYDGSPTYVEVTNISNSASTMTADIYLGNIIVSQTLSDNVTQVGIVRRWDGSLFITPLTPGQPISVVPGNDEILQGDQEIYSNQKYTFWERNSAKETDVLNHHVFSIRANDIKLDSRFSSIISNVTIQNLLEGISSVNSPDNTIGFMDPWFISYQDPDYANSLRNQGMSALFISRPSPFSPNTTTRYENDQLYNGVLLNQSVASGAFYSVRAPIKLQVNLGGAIGRRDFYFQNWTTTNVTLQQAGVNPTGFDQKAIIFNGDFANITANYKGSLLSNNTSAFANSSQRKFIRTPDGSLHMVYESMGYVWYERSSNDGLSWEIMNNGRPISGLGGKSPSIDYTDQNGYGYIGIVFQEGSDIRYCSVEYRKSGTSTIFYPVIYPTSPIFNDLSEGDAMPVIAFGSLLNGYGEFLVIWKDNRITYDGQEDGFYGAYCSRDGNTIYYMNYIEGINSGSKSTHPCLVSNKGDNNTFHLAWEDNISDIEGQKSGTISYARLFTRQGAPEGIIYTKYNPNISSGSGMAKNSMPVMIPCPDNSVRITWLGDDNLGHYSDVFRGMFPDGTWNPRFWKFGSRVVSQSLNLGNDGYFLAFSELLYYNVCQNRFTDSKTLSNIYTLNTTGRTVQLNNDAGGSSKKMFVMSFSNHPTPPPYSFTKSNSIGSYYGLYKENQKETSGRMIVLKTDSLPEFYFSLQDISVGGKPVKFMDVSDTLRITDLSNLNKYMITEPFTLTDNSKFLFNISYGVTDSSRGIKALGKEGNFSYTVDLIDEDGRVLQSFNKIIFSKDHFLKNKTGSFQVNMQGIGNKTVRMRLRTEANVSAECFLVDSHWIPDENDGLGKESETEKIDYTGEKVVKEYAISRNYPNPFNPSTVIDFQVPKTSKVTLKVFDMLGKEVTTLVNEVKEMGRYSVKFDASQLPSGTYIYEIRANDFVKSGKMMLLK